MPRSNPPLSPTLPVRNSRLWMAPQGALLLASLVGLASVVGCQGVEPGCRTNDDCREGRVCVARMCQSSGELEELSSSRRPGDPTPGADDASTGDAAPGASDAGSLGDAFAGGDGGQLPDVALDAGATDADATASEEDAANSTADAATGGSDAGQEPDLGPPAPVVGPVLALLPASEIDFGLTLVNSPVTVSLVARNSGDAPLSLTSLDLEGRPSQGFDLQPVVSPQSPLVLAAGQSASFSVIFQPGITAQFRNAVIVRSSAPNAPETRLALSGRSIEATDRSCLAASPTSIDFGVVAPGEVRQQSISLLNCSRARNVTLSTADFDQPTGAGFSLDGAPGFPLTLAPGQRQALTVAFAPTSRAPVEGRLELDSSAEVNFAQRVELAGSGGGCPTAALLAENLDDPADQLAQGRVPVNLGQRALVSALGSRSSDSTIANYQWTMAQRPMGSQAVLVPQDPQSSEMVLVPDMPGLYRVQLSVTDADGRTSCDPATLELVAYTAGPAARAEMTWSAVHDVDLHLLRSNAMGQFPALGTRPDDAYYDNLTPDWHVQGVATDDPIHFGDRQEQETIVLGALEPGRRYRLVAQYARALAFQPLQFDVTVRLITASGTQTLVHTFRINEVNAAWRAFDIDGSTGAVTVVNSR